MLLRGNVSEGRFLRILVNGGYICLTHLPICFFILFVLEEGGSLGGNEKGTDGKHIV